MDLTNQVKKFGTYPGKLLKFKQVNDTVRVCFRSLTLASAGEVGGGVRKTKTVHWEARQHTMVLVQKELLLAHTEAVEQSWMDGDRFDKSVGGKLAQSW